MLNTDKLENSIRKFCNSTGRSFEAVMHVLINSEDDFSEVVVNNNSHTEVITLDGQQRGSVLLCSKHTFLKLS